MREVVQVAREHTKRRYLVLVDGLDKVRDDPQIRDLFASGLLACPDVDGLDLVYAAPPSLRYRGGVPIAPFNKLRLGLFDIVKRDGSDDEAELGAMRAMLTKRIEAAGCRPEDALPGGPDSPAVTGMLRATGGLARDLMQIVRRALTRTGDAPGVGLSDADIESAISHFARFYLDLLDLDREVLLQETLEKRQRPGGEDVDLLVNDNLILIYDNGRPWARPHPLTLGRLQERWPSGIRG